MIQEGREGGRRKGGREGGVREGGREGGSGRGRWQAWVLSGDVVLPVSLLPLLSSLSCIFYSLSSLSPFLRASLSPLLFSVPLLSFLFFPLFLRSPPSFSLPCLSLSLSLTSTLPCSFPPSPFLYPPFSPFSLPFPPPHSQLRTLLFPHPTHART